MNFLLIPLRLFVRSCRKITRLIFPTPEDKFIRFQDRILPRTLREHDAILAETSKNCTFKNREDLSNEYKNFHRNVIQSFLNKHAGSTLRILIHVPSMLHSPGGYSLFSNLMAGLNHIGIAVTSWNTESGVSLSSIWESFGPTVFLTSDHESYLAAIDWDFIEKFRKNRDIRIGLTASLEEYGNSPLHERLTWAQKNNIDFYYSFRAPEYVQRRYGEFFKAGFKIYSVEFGANPLIYYPIDAPQKELDYIFLASSNPEKQPRYLEFLPEIVENYFGFIDGPGWQHVSKNWAPRETHRHLYSQAKVGINLHIDDSLNWASELNERTYILAACGIPQLIDNPKLLAERFDLRGFFIGDHPKRYIEEFKWILSNPDAAAERTRIAFFEVMSKHTNFHRAESLVRDLCQS